jgi:hypothetical protein
LSIDGAVIGSLPTAAASEDSDGDGAANFLEYSLDRDPTLADAEPLALDSFALNASATAAIFQYQRFSQVQGIDFVIQHKVNLTDSQWLPLADTVEMPIGSDGTLDLIEVQATLTGDTGFFRLSISESVE